ncbi:TPA: hypothetical protein EYP37_03495, partial [Candidatus Poribacteria bacterium]|nr:hypothetical protein [Candidatus Poribacteria bacterium]
MLISILHLSTSLYVQRRMRLREFAQRFWQDIRRELNPPPKSLTIEVNPALKTSYRKEYRTFLVTLQLGVSVTDLITQTFISGPSYGGYTGASSYVQAIQAKEALKQEAEAMQRLAEATAQEAQMETLNPQQGMTQMQKNLLEGQKKRDLAEAQQLQQQAEMAAEAAQKMEEKIQEVAADQIASVEERTLTGPGTQPSQPPSQTPQQQSAQTPQAPPEPAQQPNPTATAEVKAIEQEERQSDIAELRTVRRVLRNYHLRIARGPDLENDVMGDKIVFEVWA